MLGPFLGGGYQTASKEHKVVWEIGNLLTLPVGSCSGMKIQGFASFL